MSKRAQLLQLLHNMKSQGKDSAMFNIDFLIEAVADTGFIVQEVEKKPEDTGMYNQPGDMDGGEF